MGAVLECPGFEDCDSCVVGESNSFEVDGKAEAAHSLVSGDSVSKDFSCAWGKAECSLVFAGRAGQWGLLDCNSVESIGLDNGVQDGFRDPVDGFEEAPLVCVRLKGFRVDKDGFSKGDQSTEEGGVDEIPVLDGIVKSVLFWEDFCLWMVHLSQDVGDDFAGFQCLDAFFLEEDPGVIPFGFAAFDVGWDFVTCCPGYEFFGGERVFGIEVGGNGPGAIVHEEIDAIRSSSA